MSTSFNAIYSCFSSCMHGYSHMIKWWVIGELEWNQAKEKNRRVPSHGRLNPCLLGWATYCWTFRAYKDLDYIYYILCIVRGQYAILEIFKIRQILKKQNWNVGILSNDSSPRTSNSWPMLCLEFWDFVSLFRLWWLTPNC